MEINCVFTNIQGILSSWGVTERKQIDIASSNTRLSLKIPKAGKKSH